MLQAPPDKGRRQHELASALMPAPPDGLPLPRRYWAIAAIVLAIAMSVLDSSIVNVALPTIARDGRQGDIHDAAVQHGHRNRQHDSGDRPVAARKGKAVRGSRH